MTDQALHPFFASMNSVVPGIVWPAIPQDAGAHLLAQLFQLEQSQWWSTQQLADYQREQLRALLAHATEQVPYYTAPDYRLLLKLDDEEFDAAFLALPVLDRGRVRDLGADLHAEQVPPAHGQIRSGVTSGSTGRPLECRVTDVSEFFRQALTLREHLWHRRDFSLRHAFIRAGVAEGVHRSWGSPLSLLFSQGEASTFSLMADTAAQANWLGRTDPDYLLTTPSVYGGLLDAAEAGRLHLTRLREVRTVAETVTEDFRDRVRRVWGVPVTDIYSAAEVGTIALQCPVSGHYHVQSESLRVEVLDPNNEPCAPGEIGRVVITCLHNFAQPLIRYEIGDYAEVGAPCACGRGLPTLTRILGRHRNRFVHHDGRVSWPCISSLPMDDLAAVRRFQVLQRADRSLVLRYEAEQLLADEARDRLTRDFLAGLECKLSLDFERVASLPLSTAGKFEDFISEAV